MLEIGADTKDERIAEFGVRDFVQHAFRTALADLQLSAGESIRTQIRGV